MCKSTLYIVFIWVMSTSALLQNDIPTNLFTCDFGNFQYKLKKKEEEEERNVFFFPSPSLLASSQTV